jgi:hypothetical protein
MNETRWFSFRLNRLVFYSLLFRDFSLSLLLLAFVGRIDNPPICEMGIIPLYSYYYPAQSNASPFGFDFLDLHVNDVTDF